MPKTQPEPIRDPAADHLLTPQNCVLVLIDYQPEQYRTVTSSTRDEIDLTRNADELFVAVGPHRRNLVLPDSLRHREILSAALDGGRLRVEFDEPRVTSPYPSSQDCVHGRSPDR